METFHKIQNTKYKFTNKESKLILVQGVLSMQIWHNSHIFLCRNEEEKTVGRGHLRVGWARNTGFTFSVAFFSPYASFLLAISFNSTFMCNYFIMFIGVSAN